jgi:hypothetical protein
MKPRVTRFHRLHKNLDMRAVMLGGLLALTTPYGAGAALAQTPSTTAPTAPDSSSVRSPAAASEDVARLRERAAAFWAARVAGDFTKQWELLEPRGRGRLTAAEYSAGRGAVKYLAYQVEDATVDGYFSTVKVRLLVKPVLGLAGPTAQEAEAARAVVVSDKWVKIQGTWYRTLDADQPS